MGINFKSQQIHVYKRSDRNRLQVGGQLGKFRGSRIDDTRTECNRNFIFSAPFASGQLETVNFGLQATRTRATSSATRTPGVWTIERRASRIPMVWEAERPSWLVQLVYQEENLRVKRPLHDSASRMHALAPERLMSVSEALMRSSIEGRGKLTCGASSSTPLIEDSASNRPCQWASLARLVKCCSSVIWAGLDFTIAIACTAAD